LPLALGEAEGCRIPRLQGFKELEAWPHATYAGQCNPKNLWWLMGPCAVLGSGSHIQRSQADRGPKAGYFFGEARWSPSLTDFSNDPSVCLEPSWAYFACLAGVSRNFLRPTGFGSLGLVRWEEDSLTKSHVVEDTLVIACSHCIHFMPWVFCW
jgi:hypothetical protein